MHGGILLTLFLISIVCYITAYLWSKVYILKNLDSADECYNRNKWPKDCRNDDKCCTIWTGRVCRLGKMSKGVCDSKGHAGPLIMLLLGVVFTITFLAGLAMSSGKRSESTVVE
jgi:hypothetical protein